MGCWGSAQYSYDSYAAVRLRVQSKQRLLLCTPVQARWKVATQTSDIFGAGTDAKVWVRVWGPNGMLNGAEISLDNSKNNFERNALDQFFFEFPQDKDCGTPISKVRWGRKSLGCESRACLEQMTRGPTDTHMA